MCAPEPCLYILWQLVARGGGQGVEGFDIFGDEGRCHAPTRSGRAAGSTPVDQVGLAKTKSFLSKVVSQLKYSEKTTAYSMVLRSINTYDIQSCRLESNHKHIIYPYINYACHETSNINDWRV